MRRIQFLLRLTIITIGCHSLFGCVGNNPSPQPNANLLRLAVTTSTRDTGLLDELLPVFEAQQQVRVDVIAVGTGKALKLGENGDVDVILVHARTAEDAFMQAGHGIRREDVMQSKFIIVGPPNDPAHVRDLGAVEALKKIVAETSPFISRGDDSGTHKRELSLWKKVGLQPEWKGYVESGQGMGATLIMADQRRAYTLTDRGTFLRFQQKVDSIPLVESGEGLLNPYGVIVIDPSKHPRINETLAQKFVDFLISPSTQQMIRHFQIEGEPLFEPLRLQPGK